MTIVGNQKIDSFLDQNVYTKKRGVWYCGKVKKVYRKTVSMLTTTGDFFKHVRGYMGCAGNSVVVGY